MVIVAESLRSSDLIVFLQVFNLLLNLIRITEDFYLLINDSLDIVVLSQTVVQPNLLRVMRINEFVYFVVNFGILLI